MAGSPEALKTEKPTPKRTGLGAGVIRSVIFWLALAILAFLTVNSFLFSSVWPPDYLQTILYRKDYLFITIPAVLLFSAAVVLLFKNRRYCRISSFKLEVMLLAWVGVLSLAFLLLARPHPIDDAALIRQYALQIIDGNYSALAHGFYLSANPQQLGYLLFCELAYRLTGWRDPLLMQLFNIVFLLLICHTLLRITRSLFQNDKAVFLTALLLAGCLPLMLYTCFAYGTLAGLCFALLSLRHALTYLREQRPLSAVLLVLFAALAVLAKSNYLIFAVGVFLLLLVQLLKTRRFSSLLTPLALAFCCLFIAQPVQWLYSARSGHQLGQGRPQILWVAMGLQESPIAPGWYNSYNDTTYLLSGYDYAKASDMAWESIEESASGFVKNPAHAALFFYRKTVSQWNDPTFDILRISYSGAQQNGNWSPFLQNFYFSPVNRAVYYVMDIHQFVVYAGAFACLLAMRKKCSLQQLLPALILIGGFLFHTVWEAKSQYTFPYFVLLIPYAAQGISLTLSALSARWKSFVEKRRASV